MRHGAASTQTRGTRLTWHARGMGLFKLQTCEDERAHALWVVRSAAFVDVIVEGAVAVGFSAEACDEAGVGERELSGGGINLDEMGEDRGVAGFGDVEIGGVDVAVVSGFCEEVGEHAGCGGLEIVAGLVGLIEDLPPEVLLWIACGGDGVGKIFEEGDECGALGMIRGESIEGVDDTGGEPSVGAAPKVWGIAGFRVGPFFRARFIPPVKVEAGFGVAGMRGDGEDLFGGFVEEVGAVEGGAGVGEERAGHEDAVEPHLVGVYFFMPEASVGGARLVFELGGEFGGDSFVFFVVGGVVQEEHEAAGGDIVEFEGVGLVAGGVDLAGVVEEGVGVVAGVFEVSRMIGLEAGLRDGIDGE